MPTRMVYRCMICRAEPDPVAQEFLERYGSIRALGQYADATPGGWLLWTGGGIYGPLRLSCGHHRGDLKAYLREHYGTVGHHPWAMRSISAEELEKHRLPRTGAAPAPQSFGFC